MSCSSCNKDKGNRTPEEWLEQIKARLPREKGKRKELDEERVKLIQKVIDGKPQGSALRYAAWVSSSRRYLEKALFGIFGDVECSSGGRTKYNRTELGYPKEHHYDALCVGTVPEKGYHDRTNGYYLYAKAAGRGTRLRGHLNKCGVIVTKWTDRKRDSSDSRPVTSLWRKSHIKHRNHINTKEGLLDVLWYVQPDPLILRQRMESW